MRTTFARRAVAGLGALVVLVGCTRTAAVPSPTPGTTSATAVSTSASASVTTTTPAPTVSPSPTLTGYAAVPAATVLADMTSAVRAATSVHYAGVLDQAGAPVTVDMTATSDQQATGTISFAAGKVELLAIGGRVFLRAPDAVWTAQGVSAAALPVVRGKWVLLPAVSAARFRVFTDFRYFISGFENTTYVSAGPLSVGGVAAVGLRDARGTVLAVAAAGPHLLLRLSSATKQGAVTFTRWSAPVVVRAPTTFVDLARL